MNPSIDSMDISQYRLDGVQEAFYIPNFVTEDEETYIMQKINDAPKPKWKSLSNRRLQIWGGELTSANRLIPQPLPPFLNKFPDIISRLRATGVFTKSRHCQPNHVIVNEYLSGQGIMPHEDGSSYHPVVATISLGSHTIFNYYRYKPRLASATDAAASSSLPTQETQAASVGRVIDTEPVLSLLLEPRSLVITTSSLYTDHLHGIEAASQDVLLPADPETHSMETEAAHGVRVANWRQLQGVKEREVAMNGGVLGRGTRISLTCRDVERVLGAK